MVNEKKKTRHVEILFPRVWLLKPGVAASDHSDNSDKPDNCPHTFGTINCYSNHWRHLTMSSKSILNEMLIQIPSNPIDSCMIYGPYGCTAVPSLPRSGLGLSWSWSRGPIPSISCCGWQTASHMTYYNPYVTG